MHSFVIPELLGELGWSPLFHRRYLALLATEPELAGSLPERVASVERGELVLLGVHGRRRAVLAGKLLESTPACVGDFVLAAPGVAGELTRVVHVFERTSLLQRKAAGPSSRPQAIAANVDLAIVVSALPPPGSDPHAHHHGVNPRRIERYLATAAAAPARALLVLNKADLHPEAEAVARNLARALGGTDVLPVSARNGLGLEQLREQIAAHGTAVVVGSSGVGKSSLTNRLLEQAAQRVSDVRDADTRGRHTTTRRELFVLPSGGVLIDTPGLRELGLAASDDTEASGVGFAEIDLLAQGCRFRDCQHENEPGCAVLTAVSRGELDPQRLESAHKLERELRWQRARQAASERRLDKRRSERARSRR